MYKQPLSVLVVIYTVDGQALLLKRADRPDFWQSVTGSCEPGETSKQTAQREVYEETGIVAEQTALSDWQIVNHYEIYPHWRHRYAPGVTHNEEHVFGLILDTPISITLRAQEHLEWRWLNWQDAALLVFSESNARALEQISRHMSH